MKKSPLLPIFLIVLVDILGYTILIPLLPFYAQRFGAGPFAVGFLLASYGFCQMLAGPVLGKISDKVGRRPVLLISQMGTFAGFLLLAFAHDLRLIFAARIIDGLTAGNLSVAQAYIADVTEPSKRTKAFGIIGVSFGLGFLIGPAISGLLAHYGHEYSILAAAALSLLSIVFTFFLLPKKENIQTDPAGWFDFSIYGKSFRDSGLSPYLWQFLAFIFSFSIFIGGFALFAERRFTFNGHAFGAREVGYVFAYVGLLGVLTQVFLLGPLVKKLGEKKMVRAGFILISGSFFALAFVHSVPILLLTLTASFLGSSILRPSLTSVITQYAGKNGQGSVLGITQSLMSISQVTAPIITGALIQHGHLSLWAFMGALTCFLGLILTFSKTP